MEKQRSHSGVLLRVDYPDEDLRRRIESFLCSRHFSSFRNLLVMVRGGVATLQGEVGSFYEKQVALDSCRRVAGVMSLDDQLQVAAERTAASAEPLQPTYAQASFQVGSPKRGPALQATGTSRGTSRGTTGVEVRAGSTEPGGAGRRLDFPDHAGVGSF